MPDASEKEFTELIKTTGLTVRRPRVLLAAARAAGRTLGELKVTEKKKFIAEALAQEQSAVEAATQWSADEATSGLMPDEAFEAFMNDLNTAKLG